MLTACGIETCEIIISHLSTSQLQQCLPLAVLKLDRGYGYVEREIIAPVATVLTACGIETFLVYIDTLKIFPVATVLTACGIETSF